MDYRGDDVFADAWSPYWDAWLFFDQDDEPLVLGLRCGFGPWSDGGVLSMDSE